MEVRNSSLLLFDKPAIQTDIQAYYIQKYYPLNTLNTTGPLEFSVQGNSEEYIDTSEIKLYVKAVATLSDGSKVESKHKAALANLPIATLFRDVSLHLEATQIEGGQMQYPFLAYFSTVMEYSRGAQKTHMQSLGWYKDTARHFDSDTDNAGFTERQKLIKNGESFELYGPLYLNFLRQPQYLLSNTSMRIHLLPSEPSFAFNMFAAGTQVKIVFESVVLHVPRLKVSPSVINGHARGLISRNALYPLQHAEVTTFTIPKGQLSCNKEHLFSDQAPKLLLVAMLENEAYNGSYAKNPFNFQHFNLQELALFHGGTIVNGYPFQPDFEKGHYVCDYMNAMEVFKYSNTQEDNGLTKEDFGNGFTIYAFDLTPDRSVGDSHRQANFAKDFRLSLKFAKALPSTVNVLLYSVYDTLIEITKLRDVITHYGRSTGI